MPGGAGPAAGRGGAGPGRSDVRLHGGVVQTTIETTGIYDITAYGAQGGAGNGTTGGLGAEASGAVVLQANTTLDIVVGGAGGSGSGGGGGGSFVFVSGQSQPLIVAGGGGGYLNVDGGPGQDSTTGQGGSGPGGGSGGNGGSGGEGGSGFSAAGGGGWSGDGSAGTVPNSGSGGYGGNSGTLTMTWFQGGSSGGGFGGGGAGNGGGGGYSGGGGVYVEGNGFGGGGGSYIAAAFLDGTMTAGANPNANGEVIIEEITTATPRALRAGDGDPGHPWPGRLRLAAARGDGRRLRVARDIILGASRRNAKAGRPDVDPAALPADSRRPGHRAAGPRIHSGSGGSGSTGSQG